MNKETDNLLRMAMLIVIFLGIMALALGRIRKLEKQIDEMLSAPADTVTVVRVDTVRVDSPVPVHHYIKQTDTAFIVLTDVKKDTVKELVFLPREYMVYKDTNYRAVVSGVQPRLDSIEIYQKTYTNTVTKFVQKKTRWGFGVHAGYGYNGKKFSPYVGAGVQYNIISW